MPSTFKSPPSTLNSQPQILTPKPQGNATSFLNPPTSIWKHIQFEMSYQCPPPQQGCRSRGKGRTPNPKPSILNPQPHTLNSKPQLLTLKPQGNAASFLNLPSSVWKHIQFPKPSYQCPPPPYFQTIPFHAQGVVGAWGAGESTSVHPPRRDAVLEERAVVGASVEGCGCVCQLSFVKVPLFSVSGSGFRMWRLGITGVPRP